MSYEFDFIVLLQQHCHGSGEDRFVHCLISEDGDDVLEADVCHVDKDIVHVVLICPVILHEAE